MGDPFVAALALAAVFVVTVYLVGRPGDIFPLTFILAFTTLPGFIPESVMIGSAEIRWYEPLLLASCGVAVVHYKAPRSVNVLAGTAVATVVLGVLVAIGDSLPTAAIIADVRMYPYVAIGFIVASRIWGTPEMAKCLAVLPWMLWFSLALTALNSTLGFPLHGRSEATTIGDPSAADAATRIITPITYLAVFILCVCMAMAIAAKSLDLPSARDSATYWIPALAIVFFAFSRNNLLSLGAALIFTLLAARGFRALAYATAAAVTVGLLVGAILIAGPSMASVPGGAYVNQQVSGYVDRVVDGLSNHSRQTDVSLLYRDSENAYADAAFRESPIWGHGFGYAYKPGIGAPGSGFFADGGRYYVHDFYRWIRVKTGVLGLVGFLIISLGPVLAAIRNRRPASVALGAGCVGLLASSFVAPMPNGTPTSFLIGAGLGLLAAANAQLLSKPTDEAHGADQQPDERDDREPAHLVEAPR